MKTGRKEDQIGLQTQFVPAQIEPLTPATPRELGIPKSTSIK